MPSKPLVASIVLFPFCWLSWIFSKVVYIHCWAKAIALLNVFIAWYCDFLWWYSVWFLLKPLNWLVARRLGQQEVLTRFINVYNPVYITFINLVVAFDAPTHHDINIHHFHTSNQMNSSHVCLTTEMHLKVHCCILKFIPGKWLHFKRLSHYHQSNNFLDMEHCTLLTLYRPKINSIVVPIVMPNHDL